MGLCMACRALPCLSPVADSQAASSATARQIEPSRDGINWERRRERGREGEREGGPFSFLPSFLVPPSLCLPLSLSSASLSRYIESGVYNPIWPADKLPPDDGRAR